MADTSGQKGPERGAASAKGAESSERAFSDLGERFLGCTDVEKILFAKPDDLHNSDSEFAQAAWERSNANEGYSQRKDHIMFLIGRTAGRVFEVMKWKMERQKTITEETKQKLNGLAENFWRTVIAQGQAHKTINSPYQQSPLDVDQGKSSDQVFETNELILFESAMKHLDALNPEEIVTMIEEDQDFITMVIEERNLGDFGDAGRDFLSRKGKLDPQSPDYKENLEHLRMFVLGRAEEGSNEKSEQRKNSEAVLWLEIVRGLDSHQRRDLVATFLNNEKGVKETQDFIMACVTGNVMTMEEVEHLMGETGEYRFGDLKENNFTEQLKQGLAFRDANQQRLNGIVDQTENKYMQNFANQYLTFNNMIWGRVAELGALTGLVNFTLDICDRVRRRKETERNESFGEAIAKGFGDAVTNKWFWVGVGGAAIGSDRVYPWLKNAALAPSGAEKDFGRLYMAEKYVREGVQDHRERGDYLVDNYSKFYDIATDNMNDQNPKQKPGEHRNAFGLYPGDIEISAEDAGKMGYASAKEAEEGVRKLFAACSGPLGIKTDEKLDKYLQDNVFAQLPEKKEDPAISKGKPEPVPKSATVPDAKVNKPATK